MSYEENLAYVKEKVLAGGLGKSLEDYASFPRFINLETINNCTARCVMCGIDEWRAKMTKQYMNDELFKKIADEILEHKNEVQKVALFLGNEPLLDKALPQRIAYLNGGGVRVTLTSNGSLMSADLAEQILNAGLERINFSIDGLDKKDYEKVRVGLKFEEVLGNAIAFIMLRNKLKAKTSVRISVIKNAFTISYINNIIAFWEKLLDKNLGDGVKIDDLSLGISDKSKDKGLAKLEYERGNVFEKAAKVPCYAIFSHFTIKTDGQVSLCCVDQCRNVSLGNLENQSIKEIWTKSSVLKEIRKAHLEKGRAGVSFCKGCLCWIDNPQVL